MPESRPDVDGGPEWLNFAGPLFLSLLFAGIVAHHWDFVPYWDARNYAGCLTNAIQKPFDILNFRCAGHPSIVYLGFLALFQRLALWNVSLTYAGNAVLGAASIVAFHALVRLLCPGRSSVEYALVTALYAFAPLFLVGALVLNLDYGMTAFFVLFLYFLVAQRFWWASVFAVATIFSKETGAAAYAPAVVAYTFAVAMRGVLSWKARLGRLQSLAPLVTPPLVLATYMLDVVMLRPMPGSWLASYAPIGVIRDRSDLILNIAPTDAGIRSLLADVFVLNYQWLYTAVLIAAAGAWLVRSEDAGVEPAPSAGTGAFLSLLLAGLVYVVTRYKDYNNARYVLITLPVLIALFYRALLSVFKRGTHRRWFLGVTVGLVFLSNFRTIDPVSRSVFGTFRFGSHAMLDMPSLLRGPRLDSLVYNLEALEFGDVLTLAMQKLRPAAGTVVVVGNPAYNFPPSVDARSYALTADPSHVLPLTILSSIRDVQRDALRTHLASDSDRFFYLAFANTDDQLLGILLNEYARVRTIQFERSGYTLDVHEFQFSSSP